LHEYFTHFSPNKHSFLGVATAAGVDFDFKVEVLELVVIVESLGLVNADGLEGTQEVELVVESELVVELMLVVELVVADARVGCSNVHEVSSQSAPLEHFQVRFLACLSLHSKWRHAL
jgi:hypothetical protein